MEMRFNKKGFAFTFLAFFICTIFFAYIHLSMDKSDFTKDSAYKDARISYIDDELKYFKNTYGKSIISYSLYNTLWALTNFSIDPNKYKRLSQNYTHLNYLVGEGMYHGSFENISQSFLNGSFDGKDKTLKYFINEFKDNFYNTYRANLTFRIMDVNVYEKNPYYVSVQVFAVYNVTTPDNISRWDFEESFDVSVPVYSLYDPEFMFLNNTIVPIKPSERFLSSSNWTIDNFKKALDNNYTLIYHEPNYKYTLGESYLQKLLGFRNGSYMDVVGFWSFDYDEEEEQVYDSSGHSPFAKHYGNSRLLFSFDNGTVIGNNVYDLSDYEIVGTKVNGVDCSGRGVTNYSCYFDGKDDYIQISNDDLNLNHTNKITISAWINPNNYTDSVSGGSSEIFRYGSTLNDVIDLRIYENGLMMEIGNHNGGTYYNFNNEENISLNEWSHVVGSFDGDTGVGKLYVNGFLINLDYLGETEKSSLINNFVKSNINIGIGNLVTGNEHFNGSIDELAVYTKVLSDEEVATLYEEGKVKHIDYVETIHGKGIEFDGEDDYIYLDNESGANPIFDDEISQRTGEFWIKPYDINPLQIIYEEGGSSNGINVFINNSKIYAGAYSESQGWDGEWISSNIKINEWTYIVFVFDNLTTGNLSLYVNGELKNQTLAKAKISAGHTSDDGIGALMEGSKLNYIDFLETTYKKNYFFKGIIDEVKFYNRTLNANEIKQNYHNYNSYGKGCCNYLTLINPNSMGFNQTQYDVEVSYTSKTFFDYFNTNLDFSDIVLYNITNITSHDTSEKYYNFILDQCMAEAYNIFNYQGESSGGGSNSYIVTFVNTSVSKGLDCVDLIKEGIY